MQATDLLLSTLQNLGKDDFGRFHWYLSQPVLDGYKAIPKCHLEGISREHTVDRMVESYSEGLAVTIAVEILKKMDHNNAAELLKKKYTERTTAEQKPAASSSALPPSTGVTISAQDGSFVIAPVFSGANIPGSLNLNITK